MCAVSWPSTYSRLPRGTKGYWCLQGIEQAVVRDAYCEKFLLRPVIGYSFRTAYPFASNSAHDSCGLISTCVHIGEVALINCRSITVLAEEAAATEWWKHVQPVGRREAAECANPLGKRDDLHARNGECFWKSYRGCRAVQDKFRISSAGP